MIQDGFILRVDRPDVCGDSVALRLIQARGGRAMPRLPLQFRTPISRLPALRVLLQLPYWDRLQSI